MPDIFDNLDIFDHVAAAMQQSPSISQSLAESVRSGNELAETVAPQEIQWRQQGAKLVPMPQPDGTTEYVKVFDMNPPVVTAPDKTRIIQKAREEFGGSPLPQQSNQDIFDMIHAGRANEPTTVMQDFGGALGSGLGHIGSALYGFASPEVGLAMRQDVDQGYEYDPNTKAAFAGSLVANLAPMLPAAVAGPAAAPLVGELTAATMGAQAAGDTRINIAQQRANGQDISGGQELAAAAATAAMGYLGGRISIGAITSNRPYFVNKIAQKIAEYAVASGVGASDMMTFQLANNAVDAYILNNKEKRA
jgi:hypothetical protein